jgi:purine-nucleoside phosphorylase
VTGSSTIEPADPFAARVRAAAELLRVRLGADRTRAAVILGSGLATVTDHLVGARGLAFSDISGFPRTTVAGHAGQAVVGAIGAPPDSARLLILAGRVHGYEGHSAAEVTFAVRVVAALGIPTLIVTNASGGIDPSLAPGQIVAISDHLNLTGTSPLTGPNRDAWGPRFPDMTAAYARALRTLAAEEAATALGYPLREAVYAGVAGPAYETPAEIRMLALLGAGLVGMSTVHEVIAARHAGREVLGLSIVTNPAAGVLPDRALHHEDVTRTASEAAAALTRLVFQVVRRLPAPAASDHGPPSPAGAGPHGRDGRDHGEGPA